MRNELTHVNADSPEFDGGDLLFLAESVCAVVYVHALGLWRVHRHAHKKADSYPVYWYRGLTQFMSACANN